MSRFTGGVTRCRVTAAASAIAVSALCMGSWSAAAAGAATAPLKEHGLVYVNAAKPSPGTFTPGTYNLYFDGNLSGTITFNSDNRWSTSGTTPYHFGSWQKTGKSISMCDIGAYLNAGAPDGYVWSAHIEKNGTLGSATNPGLITAGGGHGTATWYAKR